MMAKRLLLFLPFVLPAYQIRWRVGMFPTSVLEVFLFVIVIAWLWERRWKGVREGWKRMDAWRPPVIAWCLTSLLAVLVAPSWWQALGLWRAYILEPLLIFLVIADVFRDTKGRETLLRSIYWVVILMAVWAIIQFATGFGIAQPWNVSIGLGRRATGPFPFPNALALFVVPVVAYAFVSWIEKRSILACVTWLMGAVAILLARSDGGIGTFLTIAWMAMLLNRHLRWLAISLGLTAVLLIWSIPAWHNVFFREVLFQGWSGKVRLIMWREAWQMLKDHWFFGVGFGTYPLAVAAYHRATFIEIFQYPHNILLNLWSEVGLLGIAAFGWVVMVWSRLKFQRIVPLLAILVHGLVDVPYFKNDLAVLFWMLAALMTLRFDHRVEER